MYKMSKYAIGVDYGTLSVRALLVNIETERKLQQVFMNIHMGLWRNIFQQEKDFLPAGLYRNRKTM